MKREPPSTPPATPGPEPPSLWIFGYGSLVWRPDFAFRSRRVGFVRGYSRRFWQGDTFHRGCDKRPGRVVTLLEDREGCTWGVAYEVRGEQIGAALRYLNVREAALGGYDTKTVDFHPRDAPDRPLRALAYVATPRNPGYLGPAPAEDIAGQILASRGCSGHNLEYLLRLADFVRLCGPQARDEHLAAIVDAVGALLPRLRPPGTAPGAGLSPRTPRAGPGPRRVGRAGLGRTPARRPVPPDARAIRTGTRRLRSSSPVAGPPPRGGRDLRPAAAPEPGAVPGTCARPGRRAVATRGRGSPVPAVRGGERVGEDTGEDAGAVPGGRV
ncbi:glutathione-specific gamma-glutamylcyclotransferase 1 [Ornithorhynchus anatinus]|uniref:glutathione-specific gamma-glutamylcyclotransferase 1 n=1 Tax=Ornithorhynchus anatinus TaxID=9258 RepID=UPI0010A7D7DC|nr:glutathione-specific gamma-glutamylcyclotransferase 1 [Ornithorhynchus anatinus]